MKIKTVFSLIAFFLLIFSCSKKPESAFSTNKAEYIAGQKISLTNQSKEAASIKWTLPDGSTATSNNADYLIPADFASGSLDIKLESYSKRKKKTDSETKTIDVIPQTYITITGTNTITKRFWEIKEGNSGGFQFWNNPDPNSNPCLLEGVGVLFSDMQAPAVGVYSIVPGISPPPSGKVCLFYYSGDCFTVNLKQSVSGTVNVEKINGRYHMSYTNLGTQTVGTTFSGEVFLPGGF